MDWENQTVVPLTIWGNGPVQHKISSAAISPDCQHLVTGSWDGNILIWSLNTDLSSLSPRWIVTGGKTSVTTLCCFVDFLVASFMDGSTCHYQLPIGRALKRSVDHNHIHTHSRRLGNDQVICAGYYPDLIVLDAYTLEITVLLQSRDQADWVSCVRSFPKDDSIQIQAITSSGFLKTWSLADISDGICLENSLGPLNVRHVKAMSFHMESRWLLLVTTSQVIVFDVGIHVLCKHTTNRALEGGDFIGDKVVFWSKHGDLFSCDVRNKTVTPILQGDAMEVYVPSNCLAVINGAKYFIVADIKGSLSIWRLKAEETVTAEFIVSANAWDSVGHRNGLLEGLKMSVLCSLHIPNSNKFVAGCSDGQILIFSVSDLLLSYFFHNHPHDFVSLNKHIGAVRCLLYPHADNAAYSENLLVSGGDDFSVCLWDIFKRNLMQRFTAHSGPVVRLLLPPVENGTRAGNTICSVSLDHSVAIYSIRDRKCAFLASQHPFPIVAVRWKPGHDFLIVKCLDGSVFVWEVSTGVLDRLLFGVAGEEVVYRCEEQNDNVWYDFYTKGPCLDELPRQPLYVDSNKDCNPLQISGFLKAYHTEAFVLLFNVNTLCSSLQTIFPGASSTVDAFNKLHSLTKPLDPVGMQKTILNVLDSIKHEAESLQEKFHLSTVKGSNYSTRNIPKKKSSTVSGTQIIPYVQIFLSLAQVWDNNNELDAVCVQKLGLIKPKNKYSFDVASELGSLSLRHPQNEEFERTRWDLVCTKALTESLGKFGFSSKDSQVDEADWLHLATSLNSVPMSNDFTFCEKLASLWQTDTPLIRRFVKTLLPDLIKSSKKEFIVKWSIYLPNPSRSVEGYLAKIAMTVCCMSIIGNSNCVSELGEDFLTKTGLSLKYVIETSGSIPAVIATAVDLIGRGYDIWQQVLSDDEAVIAILERCAEFSDADLTLTSRTTLGIVARARPSQFVAFLKYLCKTSHPILEPSKAELICILKDLVVDAREAFISYLSDIVEILVHCIDTSHMREAELTVLLGVWLPQVHHNVSGQRIAVGLPNGKLIIHELRYKRAHVATAHEKSIAAVRFSPDGKQIITVCEAGTAALWQLSHGIFDLGQFKMKKVRSFPVEFKAPSDVKGININWVDARSIIVEALLTSGSPFRVATLSV